MEAPPSPSDVFLGNGQSLDLSNGTFATVSTGGTEDVFDGDNNFSVSMWVKGWPGTNGESLLSKNDFQPSSLGKLQAWLDANNAKHFKNSVLSVPTSGDSIGEWYDLSGNKHHAKVIYGTPVWNSTAFNSKPAVVLSDDTLALDNSADAFDQWEKFHVFAAMYQHPNSSRIKNVIFGKTDHAEWLSNTSNTAWGLVAHRQDGGHNIWGPQIITDTGGTLANAYISNLGKHLQGDDGGGPGLFTMSYISGTLKASENGGATSRTASISGPIKAQPTYPFTIGGGAFGGRRLDLKVGEIIIFNDKLSDADEDRIEGYLAHKWNLTSILPSGHAYKTNAPVIGGWAIQRAASGDDAIALKLEGAGGEFSTNIPMNDDSWHHLTTTFGGGNKKIYLDGDEVDTATQTGSVTNSIFSLVLGDQNIYDSNPTRPKIDDVRFYRGVLTADEISAIYNGGAGDVGQPKFDITSPATLTGAKGKSISYQISAKAAYGLTGYNSSITYSILNAPNWVSVGSTSGTISGTPPLAGTFTFDVKAQNSLGSNVKTVTLSVYDYSAWQYALPITTDFSENSPLEDWNMLVRLSETDTNGTGNRGFRYAQAKSNGGDLRFLDNSGSELKYEIAKWDPLGESHVWVNVPTLKSDANITMYWGNPSAGLPSYTNDGSVWQNYFGVYHLEQTSGPAEDSSPLSNDITALNTPAPVTTGLAGTAYLTSNSSQSGFVSNALNGTIQSKEGTYTIWAKTPSDPPDWTEWFGLEYDSNNSDSVRLEANNASPPKANGFGQGLSITNPNDNVGSGNWQMLTLRIKDGYASIYVDGVLDGSSSWFHPGKNKITGLGVGRGIIGNHNGGPNPTVDEATFSNVGRSADWLSASYHNQKPNSTYLNFGNLVGPISLNDPTGTTLFAKKDTNMTHTVGFSGSGSFSATGLPPGLSINSATGVISGATSVVGSQNFTVTATGTTAGGATVTMSKIYSVSISDPASFPFRLNLTLSGYTGSSSLSDFPLLVSLSTSISGFSYNGFLDPDSDSIRTGGDLRFYASNGKELPYEIVDWNTSGTSQVWVKVPSISGNNTQITAVWGKTGTDTTPDYATNDSVWSNGFHGVWHLDGMTNYALSDSSPNGFHGTALNGALIGTAQIGKGIVLDGTNDFVNLGREAGNPGSVVGTSFWVKSNGTRNRILSNKTTTSGTTGWEIYAGSSNTRGYFKGSGSTNRNKNLVSSWAASNWHYVSAGYHADGSLSLQVDGVNINVTDPVQSVVTSNRDLLLGDAHHSTTQWNGAFDEVRISNVVRSADWAKAEYDNQKSSQTLVTYGSVIGPRIVTSPLTASATVGTTFSYNITASTAGGAPTSYAAIDLPAGLSFTASSGAITGTPILAGSFSIPLVVSYGNDDGNLTDLDSANDQLGALSEPVDPGDPEQVLFNLSVQALPPSVTTLAATSVSATQANLEGNVTSSGGDAPAITIYYGTSDGADNAANWSNSIELGQLGAGTFSYPLGDLAPSTAYHYRIQAVNSAALQGVWASTSQSFTTPASTNPVVANGAVINASGSQVTLQGRVISPGNGTINQGSTSFTANRYDSLMLWLDANDTTTLDKAFASGSSGVPANDEVVGFWSDKSGKGYHAVANRNLSDRRPKYLNAGLNSKPTIRFDGSTDVMKISGSETAFDQWDEMSIFIVFQGRSIGRNDHIINKGWNLRHRSNRGYFDIYGTSGSDSKTILSALTSGIAHIL